MNNIQGTHIHVAMRDSDTIVPVAFARQASISLKRDMIRTRRLSPGDSEHYVPGLKSWSARIGSLLASNEAAVHIAYNNGTRLDIQWRDETPDWSDELKYGYIGHAYIEQLNSKGNIHDIASFDVILRGTGSLAYEQWTEDFAINIRQDSKVHMSGAIFHIEATTPAPCDIKLEYNDTTYAFRRGDTLAKQIIIPGHYNFNNWTLRKAVANYNITLNEVFPPR